MGKSVLPINRRPESVDRHGCCVQIVLELTQGTTMERKMRHIVNVLEHSRLISVTGVGWERPLNLGEAIPPSGKVFLLWCPQFHKHFLWLPRAMYGARETQK